MPTRKLTRHFNKMSTHKLTKLPRQAFIASRRRYLNIALLRQMTKRASSPRTNTLSRYRYELIQCHSTNVQMQPDSQPLLSCCTTLFIHPSFVVPIQCATELPSKHRTVWSNCLRINKVSRRFYYTPRYCAATIVSSQNASPLLSSTTRLLCQYSPESPKPFNDNSVSQQLDVSPCWRCSEISRHQISVREKQ